jgi:hypothetical protein
MGQPIIIGDQLVFRSEVSGKLYLRVSDGSLKFSKGSVPEMTIDASSSGEDAMYYTRRCELIMSGRTPYSALRIGLYASGSAEGKMDPSTGKTVLNLQLGNMALRFFHAEADAMISASANRHAAFHPTHHAMKLPYLFTNKADEDDDLDDEKNLVSKSLWIVESVDRSVGGGLNIGGSAHVTKNGDILHPLSHLVRLRHAVSGRYLAVDHDPATFVKEEAAFDGGLTKRENTGPLFNVRLCVALNSFERDANPFMKHHKPNATHDKDVRTFFKLHSVVCPSGEEDTCPTLTMEDIETQNIWIEHPFVKLTLSGAAVVAEPIQFDGAPWESCWLHSSQVPKARRQGDIFDRKSLTLQFCGKRLDEDSLQIFPAKVSFIAIARSFLSNAGFSLPCPLLPFYTIPRTAKFSTRSLCSHAIPLHRCGSPPPPPHTTLTFFCALSFFVIRYLSFFAPAVLRVGIMIASQKREGLC